MGINNIQALINQSHFESHDDTDVPAALERTTYDGSGFVGDQSRVEDQLPPSENIQEVEE